MRDAHACIADRQADVRPRPRLQHAPGIVRVHLDILGGQQQLAALGHGVAGVDAQVHQHLLELRGIALHGPERVVQPRFDADRAGEGLAEQVGYFLHDRAHVEGNALALHAPGEGQHLAHQVGTAFSAALDHAKRPRPLFGIERVLREHAHAQQNGHEQVVQVVRHAADQAPDTLHALRAEELLLELTTLRYVGTDDQHRTRPAVGVAHQRPATFQQAILAVVPVHAQLAVPDADVLHRLQGFSDQCRIETVQHLLHRSALHLGDRFAGKLLGAAVPEDHVSVQIDGHDHVPGGVQQRGLLPDALFGPVALDGIANRALQLLRVDLSFDQIIPGTGRHRFEVHLQVALAGQQNHRERESFAADRAKQ